MALEKTLSIIKPDAVQKNIIGEICSKFEQAGLRIVAAKMAHLSVQKVQEFYAVHKDRHFFGQLVDFMSSGAVMIQVLEGEDAIKLNRELMGATNPAKAEPGTLRYSFARDNAEDEMHKNIVHGSDSPETAATEISFFFQTEEICPRNN